jgi:hypothetical protein
MLLFIFNLLHVQISLSFSIKSIIFIIQLQFITFNHWNQYHQIISIRTTHSQSSDIHEEIIFVLLIHFLFHVYSALLISLISSTRFLSHIFKYHFIQYSIDAIFLNRIRSNHIHHRCYSWSASLWMSIVGQYSWIEWT